ncbi:oxygenase MpaB family protein [Blastococcus sp. Marseille-P5729]|uniref:oxygenase MpaB family protein n=1 Tax=Blastococcus sp. Marseille-P5729 TaxID=2086582 RepID=UPI000D0F7851|nr:oxygenase MpaB family protein [Blastococcus sp. Marseille-P5729]
MLTRDHWQKKIATLDPQTDWLEILRISSMHEFPWDTLQALSFALYRTYAVPSVGGLLDTTGEFTERAQKRYDDTSILLEEPLLKGFEHPDARTAIRRINQMHGAYEISNDDMRYVLCTFVATPIRWMDAYGYRPMMEQEKIATANYYRTLGRHMNIKDIPQTWQEFCAALDAYEAEHFAFDEGGRRVADATKDLMASFYPKPVRPLIDLFARSIMDQPLRAAFRYDAPPKPVELISRGALKLRGKVLSRMPARRRPKKAQDDRSFTYYKKTGVPPLAELGSFPKQAPGCPVSHAS